MTFLGWFIDYFRKNGNGIPVVYDQTPQDEALAAVPEFYYIQNAIDHKTIALSHDAIRAAHLREIPNMNLTITEKKKDGAWIAAFNWWNSLVASKEKGVMVMSGSCMPCYVKVHHALTEAKIAYKLYIEKL